MKKWYSWFIFDLIQLPVLIYDMFSDCDVYLEWGIMIICALAGIIHLIIEKSGKKVKTRVRMLEGSAIIAVALYCVIYILAVT